MNLRDLRIPGTMQEILLVYRKFKHESFEMWSVLSYEQVVRAKGEFMEEARSCLKNRDGPSLIRACIGCMVLAKYTTTRVAECWQMLSEIQPQKDPIVNDFVTRCIAKFCNIFRDTNHPFVTQSLQMLRNILSNVRVKSNLSWAICLMNNLSTYTARALEICSLDFLLVMFMDGFLNRDSEKVRFAAFHALNTFFRNAHKSEMPKSLCDRARKLVEYPNTQQGATLMLVSLFSNFRDSFTFSKNFMTFFWQCYERSAGVATLMMLILLVDMQSDACDQKIEQCIMKDIWQDPQAVLFALENHPSMFRNVQFLKQKLLPYIRAHLETNDDASLTIGAELLRLLFRAVGPLFREITIEVVTLFVVSRFNNEVVSAFLELVEESDEFWTNIQPVLKGKLLSLFDDRNKIVFTKFVAGLPFLSFDCAESLKTKIQGLLDDPDLEVRKLVPKALMSISKCLSRQSEIQIAKALLARGMTDRSWEMRLAILQSFEVVDYLSFPAFLEHLSILVYDEINEIRKETIRILGGIAERNPAMVYPLMRKAILDILFICESGKSLRLQSSATELLPIIFPRSKPILSLYTSAFFPIAISTLEQYLTTNESEKPPEEQMTFFEQIFAQSLSINYIRSIGCICDVAFELARPYLPQILSLFIAAMAKSVHKKAVLRILEVIDIIIGKLGPAADIPGLSENLVKLGGRMISRKIHTAIFRVMGQLGPIQSVSHFSIFDERKGTKLSLFNITSNEDFFITTVVTNLITMLDDQSLISLHPTIHEALVKTFAVCEYNSPVKSYFRDYVLRFISAVRNAPVDGQLRFFEWTSIILACPTEWIQPFTADFVKLLEDLWDTELRFTIIPRLADTMTDAFAPFIPKLANKLLEDLSEKCVDDPEMSEKILKTLTELSNFAGDFVFFILRQIVETLMNKATHHDVVLSCLDALNRLALLYDCSSHSSAVFRSCTHVLNVAPKDEAYRLKVTDLLLTLASTLGPKFEDYQGGLDILVTKGLIAPDIKSKISSVVEHPPPKNFRPEKCVWTVEKTRPVDENELLRSIQIPENASFEQWKIWLRNFTLAFVVNSPSPSIRNCLSVAQNQSLFTRGIFNAAFLSCWLVLETSREGIKAIIEEALNSSPMNVLVLLIDLVEFLERSSRPLPLQNSLNRTKAAMRAEKPTYALHCAQVDFDKWHDSTKAIRSLIWIYTQLGMYEEAKGIVKLTHYSTSNLSLTQVSDLDPSLSTESTKQLSSLRTLENKELWEEIAQQCHKGVTILEPVERQTMEIFAHAFYKLDDWDGFQKAVALHTETIETIIYQCMFEVRRGHDINNLVNRGFFLLGKQGGPLFSHGFTVVAPFIIYAQQLVELQEMAEKRENLLHIWRKRLDNTSCHFNIIQPLLKMRIELFSDSDSSISDKTRYLKLARKSNDWEAFESFFNRYFPTADVLKQYPNVMHEYTLFMWKKGKFDEAMAKLDELIEMIPNDYEEASFLGRLYRQKAKWIARTKTDDELRQMKEVQQFCIKSLEKRENHYRTTNLWAWANMRLFDANEGNIKQHAIDAVSSFAKCVVLRSKNNFADLLQMSFVLFRSYSFPEVFETTESLIRRIENKHFLLIIQQLLAYQFTKSAALQRFVADLLKELLFEYPNGAIYPLLFAAEFGPENSIAKDIVEKFALAHPVFYESACTIRQGMRDICMTVAEVFVECVEKLHHLVGQNKVEDIQKLLIDILDRFERARCDYEEKFMQKHKEINHILEMFRNFLLTGHFDEKHWKETVKLRNSVSAEIQTESRFTMSSLSPELSHMQNTPVAVFGTYDPDKPEVTIADFSPVVVVKLSKHRPKKIRVHGSDLREYRFLLKGHEDLRLDQRVQQFFELVNSIVSPSDEIASITTMAIIPLSASTGLIQWIPGCDTMQNLIKEYRQRIGIEVELETAAMIDASLHQFDSLLPVERLEILEEVAEATSERAYDLRNVMWLKALNAESWVKQLLNFAKTSAVMSIVGYMIGLGDRHTANLMVHRGSGRVIHIDFGDCFEATKERKQMAEVIPFRLTRMMKAAMGPCSIEGSFRGTCEETARTMREHREAVMAVLEIFLREPISSGGYFEEVPTPNSDTHEASLPGRMTDMAKKLKRINEKVTGMDFGNADPLPVNEQVERLILAATDMYNLAYLYHGWAPLW